MNSIKFIEHQPSSLSVQKAPEGVRQKFEAVVDKMVNQRVKKYWVFRIPKESGGNKGKTCPVGINTLAISTGMEGEQSIIEGYDGCIPFAVDEFLGKNVSKRNRLRQGWGIPTLDLRLPHHVWIENYMISRFRYYGQNVDENSCKKAAKRYEILVKMKEMKIGDIIYVPNVGENSHNERKFSICEVLQEYYFEDRSQCPNTWEKDFGHIIEVKNIKTFSFNQAETLAKSIFGAPYLRAVDEIKPNYNSYSSLKDFAEKTYLK